MQQNYVKCKNMQLNCRQQSIGKEKQQGVFYWHYKKNEVILARWWTNDVSCKKKYSNKTKIHHEMGKNHVD